MNRLRIYISGPISYGEKLAVGSPERKRNEDAFFEAEVSVVLKGHIPTNPMRLHVNHPDWSWERKLRVDIKYLMDCDAILMLPGWNNSEGACLEREVAARTKMPVYYSLKEIEGL